MSLLVIFMYGVWSSVFSIGKLALLESPPLFLTGARMLIASLLLLGFLLWRKGRAGFTLTKKQILPLFALAFFSVYLTNALEFWALQFLSSAKTCFIYSLSPFFTALFSFLHFKERMSPRKWLGLAIGLVGFFPILATQTGAEELFKVGSFLSLPTLAMVGAAIASVYGWVLLRLLVKNESISPLFANGSTMLIGGMLALVHSLFSETLSPLPFSTAHLPSFLKWTLLLTAISNLLCYNLYGYLLRRFTATFLSFMGLLSPLFATLYGWLFLQETPSISLFISFPLIGLGLFLVYREELALGYIVKKEVPTSSQPKTPPVVSPT